MTRLRSFQRLRVIPEKATNSSAYMQDLQLQPSFPASSLRPNPIPFPPHRHSSNPNFSENELLAWQYTSEISALKKTRQEGPQLTARLNYLVRPNLKKSGKEIRWTPCTSQTSQLLIPSSSPLHLFPPPTVSPLICPDLRKAS